MDPICQTDLPQIHRVRVQCVRLDDIMVTVKVRVRVRVRVMVVVRVRVRVS